MKLYTELQVRKAIELSRDTHQEGRPYIERDEYDYSMDEVIDLLTPIELPSDEEVEKEAYENIIKQETWDSVEDKSTIFYGAFLMCAKYLRDKIQGGTK